MMDGKDHTHSNSPLVSFSVLEGLVCNKILAMHYTDTWGTCDKNADNTRSL